MEHASQDDPMLFKNNEVHRPEYLKRAKRSFVEVDDVESESGVGIAVSPNKGRRLKLFQETSEESFEESLMAGGYGRYVSLTSKTHKNYLTVLRERQIGCNNLNHSAQTRWPYLKRNCR